MRLLAKTILLLIAFAHFPYSWANISTIHSIEQLKGKISREDLVFFDLGYTLTYPESPMLARYEARSFFLDQTTHLERPLFEKFSTLLLANTKWVLVEGTVKEFINSLQSQGVSVLGITGGGRIPYVGKLPYEPQFLPPTTKQIERVESYYVEVIRSLDIDFLASAPQGRSLDKSMKKSKCSYRDGILFLGHQSMGDIIPVFYMNTPQKHARVVAIDDEIFYLRHLEQMLEKQGIPFQGYFYVRYAEMPKEYNPKIAEIELQHLLEKHEILSDEKAFLWQREEREND